RHGGRPGRDRPDDGRRRGPGRGAGDVRSRGEPLLLDRPPLGRRRHRPSRHAPRARARDLGGTQCADSSDDVRHLQDVGVVVRLVLWNLADSQTTIGELRRYLHDESAAQFERVPGLLFKAWVSDEATERWGAIYVWESREAADQVLPSRAR